MAADGAPQRRRIADEGDVAEGERLIVDVDGREIALFNVDGEYRALANYCVHQGGPLCEGQLVEGGMSSGDLAAGEDHTFWEYDPDRRSVTCPWHGWKFDVETGENVNDARYTVPTHEVEVEDGGVYVRL